MDQRLEGASSDRVSVVIPTLDEAAFLPWTLASMDRQSHVPVEVIVADAGSEDGTRGIAERRGCRVVPGGLPAVGRNTAARVATGDWLLFLDADVIVPDDGLERALDKARRLNLDALSCWFEPDSRDLDMRISHWLSSAYFWLSSLVRWPHSIGGFLLVRRSVHEDVGGFDESILVAEDQDYVRRVQRVARYAFVAHPTVRVSVRRFERDGSLRACGRWLGIELHRLFLGEVRRPRFRYF